MVEYTQVITNDNITNPCVGVCLQGGVCLFGPSITWETMRTLCQYGLVGGEGVWGECFSYPTSTLDRVESS